jgi:hypothetical protein
LCRLYFGKLDGSTQADGEIPRKIGGTSYELKPPKYIGKDKLSEIIIDKEPKKHRTLEDIV